MESETHRVPTEESAAEIAHLYFGTPPRRVARFSTGLSGYVYDVAAVSGARCVVRIGIPESRARIEATRQVGTDPVDRVQRQARRFAAYLDSVRPTPFLDDTTTKNVIVHQGRLSGIVDVDWVCFGDPLFTVALTRTALLSMGESLDYTDYWCELLELTPEQHEIIRFNTALFCVDFMSELGQRFNQAPVPPLPADHLLRLETILADQLIDA